MEDGRVAGKVVKTLGMGARRTDRRTNRGGWELNRSINASVVMGLILLLLIICPRDRQMRERILLRREFI